MQSFKSHVEEKEDYASSRVVPIDSYLNKATNNKPSITIKVSSVLKYLIVTAIILLVLNIVVIISFQSGLELRGTHRFYFDREMNLPTYFSSIIILIASFILSLIAIIKSKEKDLYAKNWSVLAFLFLLLSIDESVSFHELLIDPLRSKFQLSGFLRFSWVIAGGLFVSIFAFSYLKFFLALSRSMKILFFISGITYVSGALGMESVGGFLFVEYEDVSEKSLPYMIAVTIEETLEMTGILVFIFTLLLYLKSYAPKINLSIA